MSGKDKDSALQIIGDADVLVALVHQEDSHNAKAKKISQVLIERNAVIIFPATAVAEAAAAIQRKFGRPDEVEKLLEGVLNELLLIRYVDDIILRKAIQTFQPRGSKKHTLFDAIVAAVAKEENADAIFSFDDWYRKQGFTLAEDLE